MKKYSLLLACLFISGIAFSQIIKADLIIQNVNIVDVKNNIIIADQAVVVIDNYIKATGPSRAIQKKYKASNTIDGTGNAFFMGYARTFWRRHFNWRE